MADQLLEGQLVEGLFDRLQLGVDLGVIVLQVGDEGVVERWG